MNAAQMARTAKERNPGDFCPAKGCLFRVRTRNGVKPCPKHQSRTEGLAPETIDLMEALVTLLRADQELVPVLTEDELQLIRAKVAGGSFDDLDAEVLLDHIDAISASYEELVQRGNQEADRAQALVSDTQSMIEETRAKLQRACAIIALSHHPQCQCEFCEEYRTEHHDGYDIVNAAPAAGA